MFGSVDGKDNKSKPANARRLGGQMLFLSHEMLRIDGSVELY
jgi:uncharacterized protein YjeT (DUF2065 family)